MPLPPDYDPPPFRRAWSWCLFAIALIGWYAIIVDGRTDEPILIIWTAVVTLLAISRGRRIRL